MDQKLTEIVVIVDRSGSMASMKDEAIGGFNGFLKEQQKLKEGRCLITYTQFDTEYEVVHNGIDINEMPPLNEETYVPRGATALRDAIGKTILDVGRRLARTPEDKRPGNVVVVILTDGQENASHEFSHEQIKHMVEEQADKYNWKFVFLAQNIDAFSAGAHIGLNMANMNMFLGNAPQGAVGQVAAYSVASAAVAGTRYKAARGMSTSFSEVEKDSYTSSLADDDSSSSSPK